MSNPKEETLHANAFIVSEASGFRSREEITIAESQTLLPGTVLGQVTASEEYVQHAPGASDGSEDAVAVLIYPVTTGEGETKRAAAYVRDCEVRESDLTWADGISGAQKTTAIGSLAETGIIMR